jgi:NADH:ubiquinone oxidoreductase subunit K
MIPLQHFLFISAALFSLGLFAVITRKNAIQILMGIELMINASILNMVAFGKYDKIDNTGQVGGCSSCGSFSHHHESVSKGKNHRP